MAGADYSPHHRSLVNCGWSQLCSRERSRPSGGLASFRRTRVANYGSATYLSPYLCVELPHTFQARRPVSGDRGVLRVQRFSITPIACHCL